MTLTSKTERTSATSRFQLRSVRPAIPALLTRIDSGPSNCSVRFTAAATWTSEQTSPAMASPSIPAATDSARTSSLSKMTIRAPAARSLRAIPAPIPCPAPVTSATWPVRSKNPAMGIYRNFQTMKTFSLSHNVLKPTRFAWLSLH